MTKKNIKRAAILAGEILFAALLIEGVTWASKKIACLYSAWRNRKGV